jgi:transcription-repair coupling factor (superfamily II helicase)
MLEPLRFFGRAIGGAAANAALLPALDELPGRGVGPHPEILETRATTLSRFVSGQISVIVAPSAATILSFARPGYYEELSLSLASDQDVSLEEVVAHLRQVGYVRSELVEMPGQFCARGGLLDVFPPEAERPVRVELLGDTVESLREFDPDTQRSTGPVPKVVLPPLTEFSASAGDGSGNGASSRTEPNGNGSGSSHAAAAVTESLFELRDELLVVMDEPEAIDAALKEARERLGEGSSEGELSNGGTVFIGEDAWRESLDRRAASVRKRRPSPVTSPS